jgi:hypothetical protein
LANSNWQLANQNRCRNKWLANCQLLFANCFFWLSAQL